MTTSDSPAEHDTDAAAGPLGDQQLRHLRIFLDCNVAAIKSGTVRALIARLDAAESENQAMRDAITRLWKLELHAVDHTWMVANTDLARALHGHPVLDEIAAEAVTRALPDMLAGLPRQSSEQDADLRAARDMLRRPDAAPNALAEDLGYALGVPFQSGDFPISREVYEQFTAGLEDASITLHGHAPQDCAGQWCPQHPAKESDDA